MDFQHTIALTLGLGWASGLNLYATVFILGLLQKTGMASLPPGLEVVGHPLVVTAAGVLYVVEFFADKIPGLDSVWDGIHTFIRIPAGAVLAAQSVGHIHPAVMVTAALLGGGLAAGTHATKGGVRLAANTSPEPFSNWTLSFLEDVAVFTGIWAALNYPWLFIGFLVLAVALMAAILPVLWRTGKRLFRRKGKNGGPPSEPSTILHDAPNAAPVIEV